MNALRRLYREQIRPLFTHGGSYAHLFALDTGGIDVLELDKAAKEVSGMTVHKALPSVVLVLVSLVLVSVSVDHVWAAFLPLVGFLGACFAAAWNLGHVDFLFCIDRWHRRVSRNEDENESALPSSRMSVSGPEDLYELFVDSERINPFDRGTVTARGLWTFPLILRTSLQLDHLLWSYGLLSVVVILVRLVGDTFRRAPFDHESSIAFSLVLPPVALWCCAAVIVAACGSFQPADDVASQLASLEAEFVQDAPSAHTYRQVVLASASMGIHKDHLSKIGRYLFLFVVAAVCLASGTVGFLVYHYHHAVAVSGKKVFFSLVLILNWILICEAFVAVNFTIYYELSRLVREVRKRLQGCSQLLKTGYYRRVSRLLESRRARASSTGSINECFGDVDEELNSRLETNAPGQSYGYDPFVVSVIRESDIMLLDDYNSPETSEGAVTLPFAGSALHFNSPMWFISPNNNDETVSEAEGKVHVWFNVLQFVYRYDVMVVLQSVAPAITALLTFSVATAAAIVVLIFEKFEFFGGSPEDATIGTTLAVCCVYSATMANFIVFRILAIYQETLHQCRLLRLIGLRHHDLAEHVTELAHFVRKDLPVPTILGIPIKPNLYYAMHSYAASSVIAAIIGVVKNKLDG